MEHGFQVAARQVLLSCCSTDTMHCIETSLMTKLSIVLPDLRLFDYPLEPFFPEVGQVLEVVDDVFTVAMLYVLYSPQCPSP